MILLSQHFPFWSPCTCDLERRRCYPRQCRSLLLTQIVIGAWIALVATVGATAQQKQKPLTRSELDAALKTSINTYADCVFAFSDAHAKGTGTATEVGEAAIGDCGKEFGDFRSASRQAYVSRVSARSTALAVKRADTNAENFRDDLRRSAVARVLKLRDD